VKDNVWRLIVKAARSKGLEYDKKAKVFAPKERAAA
jgi:hypothetical protein